MLLAIITYTAFCVTHNYTVNERRDDRRSRLAIPLGETDPIPRFRADTTRIKYGWHDLNQIWTLISSINIYVYVYVKYKTQILHNDFYHWTINSLVVIFIRTTIHHSC